MKLLNLISFFAIFAFTTYGQEVWLHPNKGQWDSRIEYLIELSNGSMFVEKTGFLFYLSDAKEKMHLHDEHSDDLVNYQVIRTEFLNSSWAGIREETNQSEFYRNYLLGNDNSKWKTGLHSFRSVLLKDFYPSVDLVLEGKEAELKYSLLLRPNADISSVQIKYSGQDKLFLGKGGELHVGNRFGEMVESKPVAWQDINGKRKEIKVNFHLTGDKITFELPDGYDSNYSLIIDPSLTFSTFTGSTTDNWGMSATPDVNANLFGGGTIFTQVPNGYPTTTGAFSSTHSGGQVDIGITKFNASGTSLLYSTYLGGSGSETPNSLICAANGDLYIFGITSSNNFPMAGTPYDNSYNGGPDESANANGLGFTQGSDLFVAKLNATGTNLLASTYIGGSGTDGLNTTDLNYNYGDQFRGEIILDASNNVYVTSTTRSANFPTLLGFQNALNGSQDAVVFKMSPNLNSLMWSTFLGGSLNETGNSLAISTSGRIYVTGGTTSNNMPFTIGLDQSFGGGLSDGYLIQMNSTTGNLISGTYIGENEYDQSYMVQLDVNDKVYVYGQSESDLGVTPGHYGTPNSGQFIWKYNTALSVLEWKTMFGAGSGHAEISPTAFLVSDCYDIYVAGWGGQLNVQHSQASNSTTVGFPVTPDAYQVNTNGSNFYIAVFDANAVNLKYSTFMGGTSSSYNHVDGGTSRFDKSGRIYHAVCGSCSTPTNGFTTTPGAWSQTDNGPNCNMACFKFELSTITAIVSEPEPLICLPDPVIFNNNSSNGNNFDWDFGDGTGSTEVNPTHVYAGPGQYTVTLIVSDLSGCFTSDTVEFDVNIGDFQGGVILPVTAVCPGESYQLEAHGGSVYTWSPADVLDDPTSPTPTATIFETTDFTVVISDSCGVDTLDVTLEVFTANPTVSNDTSICIGSNVTIFATGGGTYLWTPAATLTDPNISNPVATPVSPTTYYVDITTADGCDYNDSVKIDVFYDPPVSVMPDVLEICKGMSTVVNVSGGDNYYWSPNYEIDTLEGSTVVVSPETDFTYYCDLVNACGSVTDSVFIDVVVPDIVASNDTIICPGESVQLNASGGVSYIWYPETGLDAIIGSSVNSMPPHPINYYVIGTDAEGCQDSDSVYVDLYPIPFIQTSPDVNLIVGDQVMLSATSTTPGVYIWDPAEYLSCVSCENPIASPTQNMVFTVSYVDENGCSASDQVRITFDPIIYVPNTFTPNDDESNQGFKIVVHNIESFELLIFDRWGELIYTMTSVTDFWDGTYEGLPCQDGTYVWKLNYLDFNEVKHELAGHINLIR